MTWQAREAGAERSDTEKLKELLPIWAELTGVIVALACKVIVKAEHWERVSNKLGREEHKNAKDDK